MLYSPLLCAAFSFVVIKPITFIISVEILLAVKIDGKRVTLEVSELVVFF
jgi:hypothetical protein